jgi:hypothetical protein
MPAKAGIQGVMGWIPAFAGMTEPSCRFVARIVPAMYFQGRHEDHESSEFKLSENFVPFVFFVVTEKNFDLLRRPTCRESLWI